MNDRTTTSTKDKLISEVGNLILTDPKYQENPWQALSLVGNFSDGSKRMNGYRYLEDGSFVAAVPRKEGVSILKKLLSLQDEMAKETGAKWHQCLIQIWRPGPEIEIQFEYDDPKRWTVKDVSLDMSEYANSIKPAM